MFSSYSPHNWQCHGVPPALKYTSTLKCTSNGAKKSGLGIKSQTLSNRTFTCPRKRNICRPKMQRLSLFENRSIFPRGQKVLRKYIHTYV